MISRKLRYEVHCAGDVEESFHVITSERIVAYQNDNDVDVDEDAAVGGACFYDIREVCVPRPVDSIGIGAPRSYAVTIVPIVVTFFHNCVYNILKDFLPLWSLIAKNAIAQPRSRNASMASRGQKVHEDPEPKMSAQAQGPI